MVASLKRMVSHLPYLQKMNKKPELEKLVKQHSNTLKCGEVSVKINTNSVLHELGISRG